MNLTKGERLMCILSTVNLRFLFIFSSSSSSVNNRTNTLIQHNIELEERKSIVILRQELGPYKTLLCFINADILTCFFFSVDCKVLQEQQMQVMGHLDAENKVLQTRIDNLLEWKRKISGAASSCSF